MMFEFKLFFSDTLTFALNDARENASSIGIAEKYNWVLENEIPDFNRLDQTHKGIWEFYTEKADGFEIKWKKDKTGFPNGSINFIKAEHIFGDWAKNGLYDDDAIEENEDIQYFKPFDMFVPEAECGFIVTPDKVYPSVYYHDNAQSELHDLDIDFNGYCQMAVEARVFNYWQRVLLFIQGNSIGASVTEDFKKKCRCYSQILVGKGLWKNMNR
ncbi:MAG: hypothetical protein M0D53_12750 [Flavobacterium sp. JAD_PAG50586_2]|nr:MAG: hypothetical protein M0D53_12750 [Flavobacterium sp. JAD_PAG50586_2]